MTIHGIRLRRLGWLPLAPALLGLAACAGRTGTGLPAPARFSLEVQRILMRSAASPDFYRGRLRLQAMGPEVDAVLVTLARSPDVRTQVRANALTLLADRDSPAALPVLREILISEPDQDVRAAAVLAAQRLSGPEAEGLIRSAVGDPARAVRLNAMQALDARDVASIRAVLEHETDPALREVAKQLVAIAESRGAPLGRDRRGALRTTGGEHDPQIVFRPVVVDSVAGYALGDLRVELPNAPDLFLAPMAEVVGNVVPAFFSLDHSYVVVEVEREIRVVNLANRHWRTIGPGIAPRPVPFANQFVFLRELPGATEGPDGTTQIRYSVYRAGFASGDPEWVGEIRATASMQQHANYSPVRWMVIAETSEGFALRGDGISTFLLPATVWRPGLQDANREGHDDGDREEAPR
jgi:hypothetical protein